MREPPRLGREWPFCAAPARTAVAARRCEVENPDVAVSWPGRPPVSHIWIVGPAAALRRNPGDVLIRVLDVASFAVDAILRVDDEFRRAALVYPFINAGRAIACGRSIENVMFGALLQRHILDAQVN